MMHGADHGVAISPEMESVLERLRISLKRRGAEGIRGLARHFKVSLQNECYGKQVPCMFCAPCPQEQVVRR